MGLPRFILTPEDFQTRPLLLSGGDAHHCRILRLKPNDPVLISDGRGKEYHARIIHFLKNSVELILGEVSQHQPESPLAVTLFQGFAKGSKLDWIIQKTTELGVAGIVPVISGFSQMKLVDGREHRFDRWQEIARQAVRQSGRTVVPKVAQPICFTKSLETVSKEHLSILFQASESPEQGWQAQLAGLKRPDALSLWVGPEGGFTQEEVVAARKKGVRTVKLGPRILRSETAGVAAVTLAQFFWGDIS
ncbi:16S rRNA (uracil(1498)-N(3))-methyltransferase [bacterium]|nr:16S rRNA (uracil(1498)-N(3))-methyltransferase [bacterium]